MHKNKTADVKLQVLLFLRFSEANGNYDNAFELYISEQKSFIVQFEGIEWTSGWNMEHLSSNGLFKDEGKLFQSPG